MKIVEQLVNYKTKTFETYIIIKLNIKNINIYNKVEWVILYNTKITFS